MKKLLVACSLVVAAYAACANVNLTEERHYITPIEIALASPLQLPCTVPYSAWRVWGVRLDLIYGRSQYVYGIDAGVSGLLYDDMCGIQATGFNWVDGDVYGIQAGAIANLARGDVGGIQVSGIANINRGVTGGLQASIINSDNAFFGAQFGVLNWVSGISYGWQTAPVNIDANEFTGVTMGCVNLASRAHGLQLGVVNQIDQYGDGLMIGVFNGAKEFTGVQIGLFNVIQNGVLPIMPIVNANF